MEYEIIREPFLFLETMELLYKHVNRIRFSSLWTPRRELSGTPTEKAVLRRLEILQDILDEVCQDIDAEDPKLRNYFEEAGTGQSNGSTYLAGVMVSAFVDYKRPGFEETAADILGEWETMNQKGGWLQCSNGSGLLYTCVPGSPGDLFDQIYALDLPAEFRLRLYGVLHRFPEALEELTELMRPVAAKLDGALKKAQLPIGDMAEYWLTCHLTPLEFLENTMGAEAVEGAGNRLRLAISLMNANRIFYGMEHEPGRYREYSYMYIGCCISASSLRKEHSTALDEISTILRGLSERKRLEALGQLAKKRLYGLELAEVLNMDRGNLSRLLAVLHEQGFLRQEKENQRTYYQADREAMQNFFDHIMAVIFD